MEVMPLLAIENSHDTKDPSLVQDTRWILQYALCSERPLRIVSPRYLGDNSAPTTYLRHGCDESRGGDKFAVVFGVMLLLLYKTLCHQYRKVFVNY
mmetsp:Transcript_21800/g.47378  ORF Transcript_21800/g.47378 Transcript_21800/m.47378 type:complete len:96 (+) Transcript_21800:1894-2181(+)